MQLSIFNLTPNTTTTQLLPIPDPFKARQLEDIGAEVEALPPLSFATSFRPTGVQTVMITIDK